jgi:hypothetical protein
LGKFLGGVFGRSALRSAAKPAPTIASRKKTVDNLFRRAHMRPNLSRVISKSLYNQGAVFSVDSYPLLLWLGNA